MLTGAAEQNADHRHRRSLCTRRQRPRRGAAEKDEIPPSHVTPSSTKTEADYQMILHRALQQLVRRTREVGWGSDPAVAPTSQMPLWRVPVLLRYLDPVAAAVRISGLCQLRTRAAHQ